MTPQTSLIHGIAVRLNGIRPLLMLKAYFDESGHPDDHRIIAIGGALASLSSWEKLEQEGSELLCEAGALKQGLPYFRMSEFEYFKPPFNWNRDKHEKVLNQLLELMHCYIDAYVGGCLLAKQDATSVREEYGKFLRARPYYHCFMHSVSSAELLTEELYENETTQLVFAENQEFGGQAMVWYQKMRQTFPDHYPHIESAAFAPYLKTLPLHVTDLVAYSLTRHFKSQLAKRDHMYYPMQRLLEKPCHFFGWGSNIDWNK